MPRRDPVAPLVVLEAHDALAGQPVGEGALLARAGVGAVEVHREVVLRRGARGALVEGDDLLVLPVHVVDLHAGEAPLLVEREGHVHLLARGLPVEPDQETDVLSLRVGGEAGHVHLRDRLRDVGPAVPVVAVPAGVDEHVLQAELGGEVDEVAERLVVHAGLPRHVRHDGPAPPVPGHLARLDPRGVADLVGVGEAREDGGLDEVARLRPEHEDAPGRDEGQGAAHHDVGLGGQRGELRDERRLARVVPALDAGEVQARPLPQVGLGQRHHQAVARLDRQRRADDRLRLDAEEGHRHELALVAGGERARAAAPRPCGRPGSGSACPRRPPPRGRGRAAAAGRSGRRRRRRRPGRRRPGGPASRRPSRATPSSPRSGRGPRASCRPRACTSRRGSRASRRGRGSRSRAAPSAAG